MPPTSPPTSPLNVPAFRALLLVQACFGVSYSTFLILPKVLATHLHADADQIGWIMASFGVANVLAAPSVSTILRRLGPVRTVMLSTSIMAVVAFTFVLVDRPGPLAFACRALQGIAWALMFSAGNAIAIGLAPPGRLGQAIALHSSSNLITNALAPALAEPALATWGPGPVFIGAGAVALGALALSRGLRTGDGAAIGPGPTAGACRPPEPLPRYLLFVSVILGVGCGTMFTFHQPLALVRGISRVSDFLVAYTLAAVVMRTVLGRFTDRLGPARVAFGSFWLYAAVVAAMPLLGPGGLVGFGIVYGMAHGLFFPAFLTISLQAVSHASKPRMLSWVNATFNLGTAAVAGLGIVGDRAGYGWVFVPVGVMVAAAAIGLRPPAAVPRVVMAGAPPR